MIRCEEVQERLRAMLDGELALAERERVRRHLEGCAACQRQYGVVRETMRLVRGLPQEEPPAHFTASLQVRLRSLDAAPARSRWPTAWPTGGRRRALNWAFGVITAIILTLAVVGGTVVSPRLGVAEIAQRAEVTWASLTEFQCSMVVSGTHRGRERFFEQKLWFRRPGTYRLETRLDYPLLTLVNGERVLHYLPGGKWEGRQPLVIVRPRKPGEGQLPFPFGLAWPSGPNAGIEALLRQLREDRHAVLEGSEPVLGRNCYRLSLVAVPPGGRQSEQIRMWIDEQTFLPLRITRYRDPENHLVFQAERIDVNGGLLPSDTFEFQPPPGALVIHGDVEPHVFGLRPVRTPEYDTDPVGTAAALIAEQAQGLPFPPLVPHYLPEGYRLVRVSRVTDYAVRAYWIRERGGIAQVISLVLRAASEPDPPEFQRAAEVLLGDLLDPMRGGMVSGSAPFAYHSLCWRQGDALVTLFVPGGREGEAMKIARSVRVPSPKRSDPRPVPEPLGPPAPASADAVVVAPPAPAPVPEGPPMLPEMVIPDPAHGHGP